MRDAVCALAYRCLNFGAKLSLAKSAKTRKSLKTDAYVSWHISQNMDAFGMGFGVNA